MKKLFTAFTTIFLLFTITATAQMDTALFIPPVEWRIVRFDKLDTLPAILKLKQGNIHKHVKGYVVLDKDCRAIEFIRVNTWRKKEKLLPFDKRIITVVDWRLIN